MNRWYRLYFVVIAGFFCVLGLVTALRPAKTFSPNENRVLQKFPTLSWQALVDGTYQEDVEKAASDQIPGRNTWTKAASLSKRSLGQKDINGVYLGKDRYFITKKTEEDVDKFQYMENLRYVEYLANNINGKTGLLLVPSTGSVLQKNLPKYAPFYRAESMNQAAKTVCEDAQVVDLLADMRDAAQKEQVYYRTDHHWTLQGAYVGYSAFCKVFGLQSRPYEQFAPKKVTDSFLGTLQSKVLYTDHNQDNIYAITKESDTTSVECDGKSKKSIYEKSKLSEKDKYGYFFGGNYGRVTLKTKAGTKKSLIVFKDSFANCFVPFLLEQYDEITMIDLRYYRNSVKNILQQYNNSDCLVLYEMSNFAGESNIWKLTK